MLCDGKFLCEAVFAIPALRISQGPHVRETKGTKEGRFQSWSALELFEQMKWPPQDSFAPHLEAPRSRVPHARSNMAAPKEPETQDKHLHRLTHVKRLLSMPAELHNEGHSRDRTGDRRGPDVRGTGWR